MEDNNPIKEMGTKTVNEYEGQMGSNNNNANKRNNSCALVSFVLSLIGIITMAFPCGTAAVITGIIGLVKFNPTHEKGKWMAIVGICIGIVEIIMFIASIVIMAATNTIGLD